MPDLAVDGGVEEAEELDFFVAALRSMYKYNPECRKVARELLDSGNY